MTKQASEEMDGLPLVSALKKAAETGWGGYLRIVRDAEQIGSVFMHDGNVAWAVSKFQSENFGSYLERIGLVPKEQHFEIVEKFKQLGKTKKFGALFEEAGLITHEKLRECLVAHIRNALSSLTGDSRIVVNAKCGEMNVDSNLLFQLDELLPSDVSDNNAGALPTREPAGTTTIDYSAVNADCNEILLNLSNLPGYQYAFVSGKEGKLYALHTADDVSIDFDQALTASITWINLATKNIADLRMERIESFLLESGGGSLTVQWIDASDSVCIGASFDKSGKLGVIKHKIRELIPAVQLIAAKNSNRQEN